MFEGRALEAANDNPGGKTFTPSPFVYVDPATLPPREWLYGNFIIRQFVSAMIAPGGVGKSSLSIVDALSMVTGRNLLGDQPHGKSNVWVWNGEDPVDELRRRFGAAMMRHRIASDEVSGRLWIDSGREVVIRIGETTPTGPRVSQPDVDGLIAAIKERQIDVLIVDPFVSAHGMPENDNGAMDAAVKAFAQVADRTRCGIYLVHHSRKLNGADADMDAARGGSAIAGAVRAGRALNVMSKEVAEGFGIEEHERKTYVRIDDVKANLAPLSGARWVRMVGQPLGNASEDRPEDYVGVAEAWAPPNAWDGVSVRDLYNVQCAIDGKGLRESSQAAEWVGYEIAKVLELNPDAKADKAKIKTLIRGWIASGALAIDRVTDSKAKVRPIVVVGSWAIQG